MDICKKEPNFAVTKIKVEPGFILPDIKKEANYAVTKIKKEPDFILQTIKTEPDCLVKKIKKEFDETEAEFPNNNIRDLQLNYKKRNQKVNKTHKVIRKVISRKNKKTSKSKKKSGQGKKVKSSSSTTKKSTRKRKTKCRKKGKKTTKKVKSNSNKKEARTLLDQQSSTKLRLFGFRDELEYFPLESDCERLKESSCGSDSNPKRTSLSRLDAREKVILTLKSTPTSSSSRHKSIIQPAADENVDLLDSILHSQALWHQKDSKIKVKDDGSVEIINEKSQNKSVNIKLSDSVGHSNVEDRKVSEIISDKKQNELQCTQLTAAEPPLFESLNLKKSLETQMTKINIKHEVCEHSENWNSKTIVDSDKEQKSQKSKQTIKAEIKEEKTTCPKFITSVSSAQILPFSYSRKNQNEISLDNEADDCRTFSKYSKVFFPERTVRSISEESDVEIIEIKESKVSEKNKIELEKIKKETEVKKKYKGRSSIGRSGEKFERHSRSFSRLNSRSRSPSGPRYSRSRWRSIRVITLSSSRSRSRSKS